MGSEGTFKDDLTWNNTFFNSWRDNHFFRQLVLILVSHKTETTFFLYLSTLNGYKEEGSVLNYPTVKIPNFKINITILGRSTLRER